MKKVFFLGIIVLFLLTSCRGFKKTVKGEGEVETKVYELEQSSKLDISDIQVYISGSTHGPDVEIIASNNRKVEIETNSSIFEHLKCENYFNEIQIKGKPIEIYECSKLSIRIYGFVFEDIDISCAKVTCDGDALSKTNLKLELSGATDFNVDSISCNTFNLDISGASEFIFSDVLEASTCHFDISGASQLNLLKWTGTTAEFDISGASSVTIHDGTAQNIDFDVSGASVIEMPSFYVSTAKVDVSGASTLKVGVNESITGEASGASTVIYYGDPTTNKVQLSGSSTCTKG